MSTTDLMRTFAAACQNIAGSGPRPDRIDDRRKRYELSFSWRRWLGSVRATLTAARSSRSRRAVLPTGPARWDGSRPSACSPQLR